jgi:hypothetical protein
LEELGTHRNIENVLRKRQLKINRYQSVFGKDFSRLHRTFGCANFVWCEVPTLSSIQAGEPALPPRGQKPAGNICFHLNVPQFSDSFGEFATNSDGSPTLPVMGRLSGVSPMHRGELYRDARGLGGLLLRLLFGIFSREGSYDI